MTGAMRAPLYAEGDLVTVNQTAGVDHAHHLMPGPAVPGRTGIVQRVKVLEGSTPRYHCYFDICPGHASITWLRESSLDPANPRTFRQLVRATKQLELFS